MRREIIGLRVASPTLLGSSYRAFVDSTQKVSSCGLRVEDERGCQGLRYGTHLGSHHFTQHSSMGGRKVLQAR